MWTVSFTHRLVGLLLTCVLRRSARVGAHLHVHGIDDVKEIFDHSDALQGGVVLG